MKSTAVINSKGQIVIPAGLRRRYRLNAGTTVNFHEERGGIFLEPRDFEAIYALKGSLREYPLEASLEEERQAPYSHGAGGGSLCLDPGAVRLKNDAAQT